MRLTTVVPRVLAIAGAALVVYQWAVARPLWLDEEMIALNIRDRGFVALAGKLSLEQSAPYGWLALERSSLLAFGTSERSLRLVPLLFGLATIAAALWIGRRWLDALSTSILVCLCAAGQWISYSFVELKQYSADVCFGLLLPALAAWALETDRVGVWWCVAAIAQLVGNGALFVAPLCAVAIVAMVFQRRGLAGALRAAAPGMVWLAVFAANYLLVLRPAQASEFLQSYWQSQFPPASSGVVALLAWTAGKLGAFAVKPAGTRVGWLLWTAAVGGYALARGRTRPLALMFATVPLAGLLWTTVHFVPFFERLVLWIVPAIYVGVALLAHRTVRLKPDTTYRLRPDTSYRLWPDTSYRLRPDTSYGPQMRVGPLMRVVSGFGRTITFVVAVFIAADITYVGLTDLSARPATTNHRLDDRSTVRWLATREEAGDVWLTTHLALPAIWWYAPNTAASIVQVDYADPGPDCRPDALARGLGSAKRALVFTGFHFDDQPPSFDDLLLERLMAIGQMTGYRGFEDVSRAAIVDRRLTSRRDRVEQVRGCLRTQPARRW